MNPTQIHKRFSEIFKNEARIFRSPGRINIIGEHTDYNNGFVLPAAVDKDICIAVRPNDKGIFRIHSLDVNEQIEFTLENYSQLKSGWPDYILGVIDHLVKKNHRIKAFDCVFGGDIPIGAGMSSSAALTCVTAFALNSVFSLDLSRFDIIDIAQRAEIDYAGLNCGIMDQFASVFSKKGHVTQLDCRNLSYKQVPMNNERIEFILVNSMVKHNLAATAYNQRRQDCEESVKILKKEFKHVNSLRDVDENMLNSVKSSLSENQFKRSFYVIRENQRVLKATDAILQNDFENLGLLMNESHFGLKNQYEVSCYELDFLQEEAIKIKGVSGSRMMGGGFGGCTINLVEKTNRGTFTKDINEIFLSKFGQTPEIYHVEPSEGSSEILN